MKRTGCYIISVLAWLLIIVAILFTCLQIAVNDRNWFLSEYVRLDTARSIGMSNTDVAAALGQLVDYMEGREDSIQLTVRVDGKKTDMYNQREIDHMVDVRALYQAWRGIRTLGALLAAGMLYLCVRMMRRDALKVLSKGFLIACGVFACLLAAIGIWVAVDFTGFWTAFHLLFFTNDLWLLDPRTSRMILICPERLFYDIVLRFGGWFALALAVLLAACVAYLSVRKKRRKTPLRTGGNDYDSI